MPDDRQRVLLAVLRARGPANASVLAHHPVVREHYPRRIDVIEADLEELVETGHAIAHTSRLTGADVIEAYDVPDAERTGWRARYRRNGR